MNRRKTRNLDPHERSRKGPDRLGIKYGDPLFSHGASACLPQENRLATAARIFPEYLEPALVMLLRRSGPPCLWVKPDGGK